MFNRSFGFYLFMAYSFLACAHTTRVNNDGSGGDEARLVEGEGAASRRRIGAEGLQLIKSFESFQPKLYEDAAGHCTIGYGHLVHNGGCNGSESSEFKRGISASRAETLLKEDLARVEATVQSQVRVDLNSGQFDALCSFVFNVGRGAFIRSTLLEVLNDGAYDQVPAQLMRWVGAKGQRIQGLVSRRRAEVELFTGESSGTKGLEEALPMIELGERD